MSRKFGDISGILEGDTFANRAILASAKVHRHLQAGINGSEKEGADSIVISGGYEDDQDFGNVIIYTGHGGRSEGSKHQVADQTLTRWNKALAISCEKNLPVRVVRGANKHSTFAPEFGYRYDGLYNVTEYWREKGKSGFVIWRFRLEKIKDKNYADISQQDNFTKEPKSNYLAPNRKEYVINRIIRETKTAQFIKQLYDDTCQICGIQIKGPISTYSEAAHIKSLGQPHNGPDTKENLICLCPNHHKMFDLGAISIDENLNILGLENVKLIINPKHNIDSEFTKYHRTHHYKK